MPSSSTRRILTSDIKATPWKNGGGVTREIATSPSPSGGGSWGWRVSLAEVAQDGPFSNFPETDRVIAVIDGEGMDLVSPDGATIALEPFQAVRISGDEPLSGRLRRGPVRDLNVMVLRRHFAAEMDFWHGPRSATSQVGDQDCLLIHNLAGGCAVRVDGGKPHDLMPGETLVHEGQGRFAFQLADDSRAAVIRIGRRQEG
ncbi:MAG: HutD family protein [Kiloniellaceae bacterium]